MSLKSFFDYLEIEKKYSSNTIEAYRNDLNVFARFLIDEFDVTNKFWEVIKIYAQKSGRMEIDEYGWLGTLQTIMYYFLLLDILLILRLILLCQMFRIS